MGFVEDLRRWGLELFGKYYGPYKAIVLSNKDPLGIGRIQVKCPRARIERTNWLMPMMQGAGQKSGLFWPPEPNDGVFIFFDNGDAQNPMCYGGGWYGDGDLADDIKVDKGTPPLKRGMVSPGGHQVILDDTQNDESISIKTFGGHEIILSDDSGGESILIRHKSGKMMQITSGGKVKMGDENGQFEPMFKAKTVKMWLETHNHGHALGPTSPPIQPFPPLGLSSDVENS